MLIGFVGDVHGRVLHMLALVLEWQRRSSRRFDQVIQVGDMGAFPDPGRLDEATQRFAGLDKTELDFSRLLTARGALAEALTLTRETLSTPAWFIRGNHEDFNWLNERLGTANVACVDRFDLLHYVRDGWVVTLGDLRVAFLGGTEAGAPQERIDEQAAFRWLSEPPHSIDVLVTHDAPYGVATGYFGQVQGSRKVTQLIEKVQPRYHIAGHLHHMIGPEQYGRTAYLGLSSLLPSPGRASLPAVQPGSLAVLDTDANRIEFVTDAWVSEVSPLASG
jgi:hypothetical protein